MLIFITTALISSLSLPPTLNRTTLVMLKKTLCNAGADPEILKRGALYVGHGWPLKKILGFRWSKKIEITLETISFWQNISISIFRFSQFLSTKSYQIFQIY